MDAATTTVPAGSTVGGHHGQRWRNTRGWRIVAALAITRTVGYGTPYASIAGRLAAPVTIAKATAPLAAAALLHTAGGYNPLLAAVAGCCALAAAGMFTQADDQRRPGANRAIDDSAGGAAPGRP